MKKILLLSFCLSLITNMNAQSPVQFNARAKRTGDNTYSINVKGTISPGWHVYAKEDSGVGIEPLRVEWENENIVRDSVETNRIAYRDYNDPLFDNKSVKVIAGNNIVFTEPIKINGAIPSSLKITVKGFASNNEQFLPIEETTTIQLEGGTLQANNIKLSSVDLQAPAIACGEEVMEKASLLTIFLKGLAGGIFALLMPCLFPMIPVTVSFFTDKASTRRKAIRYGGIYGLSILGIYLLASLPFHIISGVDSQVFNSIATNAWINVAFFIVFILFALSLFGLFELRLPAALSNRAGANSNIRSLPGIFFMALTLVIVSFSCTGPILGTLLVASLSKQGNAWELTAGLAGFGLALALPFALFAMFPQWLKSLPKNGSWLDKVKKILAFVELALAFKFLSNADLVEHWGLLKREVFIAIWILITLGMALYITGIFDNRKEMKLVHPKSKYRLVGPFAASLCFAFVLYLVPGLTNTRFANLKLVSGFPPPLSYSVYGKNRAITKGPEPNVINDYDKALMLSKQTGKPLLIDFTGWACVNCRKMEELVWTQPAVEKLIKEFILVSLYVDDRQPLPVQKQFSYLEKEIKTLGDKWAAFQAVNFGGASQPMYVVLSPDEQLMNLPVGYSPAGDYKSWLECGLKAWQQILHIATQNYTIH